MTVTRWSRCLVVASVFAGLGTPAPAFGQQIVQIIQEAKVAERRLTPEQTQSLRDFAQFWMAQLNSIDPEEVSDARNAILQEFRTPGISDVFRDAFSIEIAALMGEAVRSDQDLVRINAMIIATQLTHPEANQIIDLGLNDENAAVQYWGAKAYLYQAERAAEGDEGMPAEDQHAIIAKIQQVFADSPAIPVARVGFEVLVQLEVPEARDVLLSLLHQRLEDHREHPSASYLAEQAAVRLLTDEISRDRRPDQTQIIEFSRAAYRYFVLTHAQMQAGAVDEDQVPGHLAMMDWCYKCLYAMSVKFPGLNLPNDLAQVNVQIRDAQWDNLQEVAERWHQILTARPFAIDAAGLE